MICLSIAKRTVTTVHAQRVVVVVVGGAPYRGIA